MQRGAYVINVARGAVIDTPALVAALEAGEIAGAGLDVTEPEPLPSDCPLLGMDNVVILPHVGTATVEAREAMEQLMIENMLQGLAGEHMSCEVK